MNMHKRRTSRRRAQRWATGVAIGLTALCVGGIALMPILNAEPVGGRYTYTTESDIWYVDEGNVEVAAAQPESAPPAAEATPAVAVTAPPAATAAIAAALPTPEPEAQEDARGRIYKAVAPPTPEPTRAPATITITAAGDCTLGTYTTRHGKRSNFKAFVEKFGYDYFFENVRALFEQDDLTIVNLEGPLTDHSKKRSNRTFNFRGYPDYVNILTSGSVEICNLANNHALDYQKEGFQDTCEALEAAGIGASGYGPEYYTEVNGYTVGSLGFTEWNFEAEDILAAVEAASRKCDLLIVSMHWGKEWQYELSKYARNMGRALIDAGADVVIGNHSHVYGEIEKYNGKYIINSLGNFCFGGNDDPQKHECVLFRQKFIMNGDGSVTDGGIDLIPAMISSHEEYNDFQPRLATPEEGAQILAGISKISKTLAVEDVLWLEDSFVVRNGLLPEGGQTGAQGSAPDAPAQEAPADAAPTQEMEIAMDVAR